MFTMNRKDLKPAISPSNLRKILGHLKCTKHFSHQMSIQGYIIMIKELKMDEKAKVCEPVFIILLYINTKM